MLVSLQSVGRLLWRTCKGTISSLETGPGRPPYCWTRSSSVEAASSTTSGFWPLLSALRGELSHPVRPQPRDEDCLHHSDRSFTAETFTLKTLWDGSGPWQRQVINLDRGRRQTAVSWTKPSLLHKKIIPLGHKIKGIFKSIRSGRTCWTQAHVDWRIYPAPVLKVHSV